MGSGKKGAETARQRNEGGIGVIVRACPGEIDIKADSIGPKLKKGRREKRGKMRHREKQIFIWWLDAGETQSSDGKFVSSLLACASRVTNCAFDDASS